MSRQFSQTVLKSVGGPSGIVEDIQTRRTTGVIFRVYDQLKDVFVALSAWPLDRELPETAQEGFEVGGHGSVRVFVASGPQDDETPGCDPQDKSKHRAEFIEVGRLDG